MDRSGEHNQKDQGIVWRSGSSKSWDAAAVSILIADQVKAKTLCLRQLQNKIEESVYTLLVSTIHRLNLSHRFKILNNKIINKYTKSEYVFYGIWRNIEEIKSTEGVDICWIEESQKLTKKQWSIIEPTLRNEGSQFWIIFNPEISTDFVYQRFIINPPADTIIRKINYDENPYLSNTIRKVIEDLKKTDPDEYRHIYQGEPYDDDESVIIKRAWLNAAIDAHIKLRFEPEGSKRIGFDIADDGGDRCVNVYAHGNVALDMDWWQANEDELMKSCRHTYSNARKWQASITYDSIGVGSHAGSKFKELNEDPENPTEIDYFKFLASGEIIDPDKEYKHQVINKDMFSNLKAQAWWLVADRLRNTWDAITNGTEYHPDDLISISSEIPDLEKLLTELSTPKKDYDKRGKVKVESKDDLEAREIDSPDLADAFIMAFAPSTRRPKGFFDVFLSQATG